MRKVLFVKANNQARLPYLDATMINGVFKFSQGIPRLFSRNGCLS